MSDTLIKVESVSKKFCRSLKQSLWYGMKDLGNELLGKRHGGNGELRPDEFWAINDISFELKRGECLGLVGANGAGKSTLLKMLNGLIKPDMGRIEINGRVGALIELGAGFNPILTGRENIYVNGAVLGLTKEEIDEKFDAIVEFSEIEEFIDTPVQNYSSGMKVRLGFAVAAQVEPDVLLIDEVLAVGDMGFKMKCLNRISQLLANSAVIFVSHSMPQILRISSHALLLKKGECVLSSPSVSQVVDTYSQGLQLGKPVNIISKNFELLRTVINGQAEDACPVIPYEGQLEFEMDFNVHAKCRKLEFRMVFWNHEQRPVLDILSQGSLPYRCDNDADYISLSVTIPSVRLAGGKYSVIVVASDQESMEILCRVDNATTFVMENKLATYCEYLQPALWSRQQ